MSAGPRIAIVGSGPAGCYSAQAIRRVIASARIDVFDALPVPFGLVRHGVAADHQGTKSVALQFARLFENDGVRFVGNVRIGVDIPLDRLRAGYDAVVLATGLTADIPLDVPGAELDGVHGSGRITRLLNAHPLEPRPAPSLGASVGIVGHGNVALDLIRLLAKPLAQLTDSDIDEQAHRRLAGNVSVIHAFGRSSPAAAKFDAAMLAEVSHLPHVAHVVHGLDAAEPSASDDPRSIAIAGLRARTPPSGTAVRVEWWFGYAPVALHGAGRVRMIEVARLHDGQRSRIAIDSVISAIGFRAAEVAPLVRPDETSTATGRIEPGLYAAGWLRRGPRGTIPSQRTDARHLAELIRSDLAASDHPTEADRDGQSALLPLLSGATDYAGWLAIDAHELGAAVGGRPRAKLSELDEMLRIARAVSRDPSEPMYSEGSASAGHLDITEPRPSSSEQRRTR